MRRIIITLLCFTGFSAIFFPAMAQKPSLKPRIIITADPELDDLNSLIRFLLYSSDFRVEGLVYASSQFHWSGDGTGKKFMVPGREYDRYGLHLCPCESYRWKKGERFIHEAVEAYEKVYHNLVVHNPDYPLPSYLKSKIRYGNIEFEGDFSKNTEGSDLIKAVLMDNVPGPVYVTAWGGQSTIARALKSIEETNQGKKNWPELKKKISRKLVILPSGDQDNTYASYIKPNWPDVDYRQFRNGPNYGYGAQLVANPTNAAFLTADWMKANISSKGPMGSLYRVWGDGKQLVKGDIFDYFGMQGYTGDELKKMGYVVWMPVQPQGSWLGEGDTFTFMNLLDNGLNGIDKNNPGGWSGRIQEPDPLAVDPFSNDTSKVKDLVITDSMLRRNAARKADEAPFPDFFAAAQQDFAARMQWTVTGEHTAANHAPVITLVSPAVIRSRPGATVKLEATVKEPDGNPFTIKCWQFSNSLSADQLQITNAESLHPALTIPATARKNQTLFVVLEAADQGSIPLRSYKLIKIML